MDDARDNDDIDNRQAQLPAEGETDLDDPASLDRTPAEPRIYQDDLDYKDSDTDPIIEELTDNPAKEFGIPESEYKQELDKYAGEGDETEDDDMREAIEDLDEADDNPAANS